MEHLTLNIDKKRVAQVIALNAGGVPPSDDFNRSSLLGAKAAGVAQRMRQTLVGDAETTDRLIEAGNLEDPVGHLAAQIESAYRRLAMSRNMVFSMAFIGETDSEDMDVYCQSLASLCKLYNDGVDLLARLAGKPRDILIELLMPLREDLLHANRLYRKRLLGLL